MFAKTLLEKLRAMFDALCGKEVSASDGGRNA